MTMKNAKHSAILLLGPTGAGKSPLGDFLEEHGFFGKRCFHFDFGANLRAAASGEYSEFLSTEDIDYIKGVLKEGLLLENETFYIAAGLVRAFIQRGQIAPANLIVLNGLPRHVGQADDVAKLLQVRRVFFLDCNSDVVLDRIKSNSGGDRTGRTDDSIFEIEKKIKIFRDRTVQLLDYYRSHGVQIERISIEKDTSAKKMYNVIIDNIERKHDN